MFFVTFRHWDSVTMNETNKVPVTRATAHSASDLLSDGVVEVFACLAESAPNSSTLLYILNQSIYITEI